MEGSRKKLYIQVRVEDIQMIISIFMECSSGYFL